MTTTEIRWVIDSVEPTTISVVRVTRTVDRLAGPFTTVTAAKRWITQHADQAELFDDDNQPALIEDLPPL